MLFLSRRISGDSNNYIASIYEVSMDEMTLFLSTLVLGGVTVYYGFMAKRHGYSDHGSLLSYRALGILLLYVGFSVHTLGDLLEPYYGEAGELLLESIAHVIILVSFVFFYKTALQAKLLTKEFWFR